MTRIASFDVFDTLITRLVGAPRQVFVTTGRQLQRAGMLSVEPQVFAAAREQAAWDLTPDVGVHPPLHRIAEELAARLGLSADLAPELAAAELDVEREVCRAVPGSAARVARSRRDTGRGVVFISDTPLPEVFLRELLAREGLFADGDRLYTSADEGASKQDGRLFDVVAADLGCAASDFDHVGDDRWSDLAHPLERGWNATLDSTATLTGRETYLDRQDVATAELGPRLAGAARIARLTARVDGGDPALASIAGAVALPLLAGFGLWVLRQAQLLELDRLYFVARDGEVFLDVTSRIAARRGDNVECRYLYGSRLSWQLASRGTSVHEGSDDFWLPDEAEAELRSARDVLALVDLTPNDAYTITAQSLFAAEHAEQPLGVQGWQQLRQLLATDPMSSEIRRRARDRRELLLRYVDQEGLTAPGRVGLVDVGWTGRAARSFEDVLIDSGRPLPAAHLFLGLLGTSPTIMGADLHSRSRGWLVDEARGMPRRTDSEDPVMVVESFCMGSEGHTIGYLQRDDVVVADLIAARNPAAARWGLAEFRQALSTGLDALLDGPPLDAGTDLRPLVWHQILDFWRHPSRAEAQAWGAQPYGEDFHNAGAHPLATPVTNRRMLARLGLGKPEWREPTYWLAGTIAVSGGLWRRVLLAASRADRLRCRLVRVPTRVRRELLMRRRRPL